MPAHHQRIIAPPQSNVLLATINVDEVKHAIAHAYKVPDFMTLNFIDVRQVKVKALGGEALQISSQTYYVEVYAAWNGKKMVPPQHTPS